MHTVRTLCHYKDYINQYHSADIACVLSESPLCSAVFPTCVQHEHTRNIAILQIDDRVRKEHAAMTSDLDIAATGMFR